MNNIGEARCADCGLAYSDLGFVDLTIPSKAWKKIAPNDGLLCPTCMCRAAAKLGIRCAAWFSSGPFYEHRCVDAEAEIYRLTESIRQSGMVTRAYAEVLEETLTKLKSMSSNIN